MKYVVGISRFVEDIKRETIEADHLSELADDLGEIFRMYR